MILQPNPAFVDHLTLHAELGDVPAGLIDGLVQYCAARRPMGGFLTAVVKNDLKEAVGRADPVNLLALHEIVVFLFNHAPGQCWGSPELVEAWLASGEPVPENYD